MTFRYHDGILNAEAVPLTAVAAECGTPCYVYSQARIVENYRRVRATFPTADLHYSLKANANLSILRLLLNEGAGFDAVSAGEIYRALQIGAPPEHIVFAGVGKTRDELAYALEAGIGWFNVESMAELARLNGLAAIMGKVAQVALRVNPAVRADTHHYIATGHAAAKFGMSLAEAKQALGESEHYPHLRLCGVHVHIGSQLGTVERTLEALDQVLPLFDAHPSLDHLNVGGGFPVAYNAADIMPPVEAFGAAIAQKLAGRRLQLMLEPGRYIVAEAGVLLVEVQYVKASSEGTILVTDGGMTELIRPALYGAAHNVLPVRESDGTLQRSHVVGPVCESADVLRVEIGLPALQAGDLLAVTHVGAYGAVMGSNYNARPRPPEILVEGEAFREIRKRESWRDLVRLELESTI